MMIQRVLLESEKDVYAIKMEEFKTAGSIPKPVISSHQPNVCVSLPSIVHLGPVSFGFQTLISPIYANNFC